MSLSQHESIISPVEITNISTDGVWLPAHGKEPFMSYDDFPWFRDQSVKSITSVEEPLSGHFYWPDADVDVTEEIIENPEKFPPKAKSK